jgi:hypothetical protein
MDEVIVVGYGTQRKSVVTGAISKVRSADLEKVPNTRIEQSLQGRVSGVTHFTKFRPAGLFFYHKGTWGNHHRGCNNPLWVVDGVVVDQGGISYLNQSDIESIEVLKDAAHLHLWYKGCHRCYPGYNQERKIR